MAKVKSLRWSSLLILVLLISSNVSKGQIQSPYSTDVRINYLRTWEVKAPITDPALIANRPLQDVLESTQYFDGLGRLIQQITKKGSMVTGQSPVDLVVPNQYDDYGRETYKFLPFPANTSEGNSSLNDGKFKFNPFQQSRDFSLTRFGDGNGYEKYNYEQSPLNRILDTYAPGESWVGSESNTNADSRKNLINQYLLNSQSEGIRIWLFANGNFSTNSVYGDQQLYKFVKIDENKSKHIIYVDKEGQIILKKDQASVTPGNEHTGWLCTYYLYDDAGNLRLQIQPRGVELLEGNSWNLNALNGDILNEQCFRYEYDGRKRMVVKKMPGREEVRMVYDSRDRLVLSQDGNLRSKNQWLFSKFDHLNRPVASGIYTNNTITSQSSMQAYLESQNLALHETFQSDGSFPFYSFNQSFPSVTFNEVLTLIYYDDYKWAAAFSGYGTKDNSFDSYFPSAGTSAPYPQPIKQAQSAIGLVTGTWDRTGTGLVAGYYYDEKGNIIQTRSNNLKDGVDIITSQYSFKGQLLQTVLRHQRTTSNPQVHLVTTKYSYDDLGRLLTVKKAVNSTIGSSAVSSPEQLIVSNEYNELGDIKKQKLGNKPQSPAGTPLTVQDFDYNIRGWLTSINKDFITGDNSNDQFFGMEIGYDKNGTLGTFSPQFSGNIGGVIWKNQSDQRTRKYNYSYDAASRLKAGAFTQHVSGSGTAAIFDNSAGIDFSVSGLTYDANGNILAMQQKGWKPGGSSVVDDLTYNYYNHSNKLKNVIDQANDTETKLGDFRSSKQYMQSLDDVKTVSTIDYIYDVNGNMVKDLNKDIDNTSSNGIEYNYLNLPVLVKVKGKGQIEFLYDNRGNKLQKIVTEGAKVTTTEYIYGFEYKDNVLQQIAHEAGRIRLAQPSDNNCPPLPLRYVYDYQISDNLGNVRMVLTEEQLSDCYPAATVEDARIATEKLLYSIDQARVVAKTITGATQPSFENKLYRTHGGLTNEKTGLGIVLKVMSGDKLVIRGESSYTLPGGGNVGAPITMALTELLAAFIGSGAGATKGVLAPSDVINQPGNLTSLNNFLNSNNPSNNTPKAAINWILLDEQFQVVSADFDGVQPGGGYKNHTKFINTPVNVTRSGYLYVYVSNESNLPVYFDNLQVTHQHGPIVEATDYYPFGLAMAGISSKAAGVLTNKAKFNGQELQSKEFEDGAGLEWYDYGMRNYDAQTGRWFVPDPLSSEKPELTPYRFGFNNPVLFRDFMGLFDWYENENGEIVYDERVHNQEDLDKLGLKGKYLGVSGFSINEETGKYIYHAPDGTKEEFVPPMDEIVVTPKGVSKTQPANWLSASNILSYAGAIQVLYEKFIFDKHRYSYKPSKGPTAGKWTPIWKTRKGGFVRSVNALADEDYLVLRSSKNAARKYNAGKTLSKTGKLLGGASILATVADGVENGWKPHHTADVILGVAMTFGPVGWIGGLIYFGADMITQGVTGKSITENLFD